MSVEPEARTIRVTIRGRVQGVGYRFWTQAEAERRGVSGHVRNLPDGAVEAVLSGPVSAVAAFVEACRRGPPGAQVDDLVITEHPGRPRSGFVILRD